MMIYFSSLLGVHEVSLLVAISSITSATHYISGKQRKKAYWKCYIRLSLLMTIKCCCLNSFKASVYHLNYHVFAHRLVTWLLFQVQACLRRKDLKDLSQMLGLLQRFCNILFISFNFWCFPLIEMVSGSHMSYLMHSIIPLSCVRHLLFCLEFTVL